MFSRETSPILRRHIATDPAPASTSQTSNPVGTHNGPRRIFLCRSIGLFLFLILLYPYVVFFAKQSAATAYFFQHIKQQSSGRALSVRNQIKKSPGKYISIQCNHLETSLFFSDLHANLIQSVFLSTMLYKLPGVVSERRNR